MATKIKELWYNLVARSLVDELDRRKENYLIILGEYIKLNSELHFSKTEILDARKKIELLEQRQEVENRDGAIAVQVIKERMRQEELPQHVASARQHGLRSRNMELIRENAHLAALLKRLNA